MHGRVDRPPVGEDRQGGQHVLLRVVEQSDAPFDGRAQCALTLGKIDRAGTQGVEATSEPSEQRTWLQQSGAGRGELDGERQTIEAPADLHDGQRVVLGQGEVVADGLGSIDEQLHGGQRGQLLPSAAAPRTRAPSAGRPGTPARPGAEARCGSSRGSRGRGSGPGAGRARARRPRPVRGCPARARSASPRSARPGRPAAAGRPRWSRPPRRRCEAAPARAGRSTRAARTPSRAGSDHPVAHPTAIASRVLPMPPGPVRVTNRTSGVCEQFRDLGDVVLASDQRRRRHRQGARAPPVGVATRATPNGRRGAGVVNRSLRSRARSSRTSRPSSRGLRNDR